MKYLCLYYSATGNTKRAVELTRKRLEAAGSTMDVVRIKKTMRPPQTGGYDGMIVAFPVLAMSPPVFVKRFIRSLPNGKGLPAHVLAVDGGGGGSAAATAVRILEGRGYRTVLSARPHYPDNWTQAWQPPEENEAAARTREGDAIVIHFADSIASGRADGSAVDRRLSGDVVVGFLFGSLGRRFLGKAFYADEDCDACGKCAVECPAGAIVLKKGERARPFWKMGCEDCNACINRCPRNAINTSLGRLAVLIAFITACAVIGVRAYFHFLKPAAGAAARALGIVSPALGVIADVAVVTLIILASHLLIGPFDRYLLRFIQRIPGVRRFFSWTFTKNWRRYRAEAE
jgi:ferredoxin